jgi:hypothetical protein
LISALVLRNTCEVTRTQPSGLASESKSSQVATLKEARRIERLLKEKKNPTVAIYRLQQ